MILQAMIDTAAATLFAALGVLVLAAGLRVRVGRAAGLLLGTALIQHSVNQLAASPAMQAGLGGSREWWMWAGTINGYLLAIPWPLLVEQIVGPGWRSSIRRTRQAFWLAAAMSIACDVAVGRAGTAGPAFQALIIAGAFVFLANLVVGRSRMAPDLTVLRIGFFIFMAVVIHDALVYLRLLPGRGIPGQAGLLIFVGCFTYTVVSRTLRGERHLQAMDHELETARQIQASLVPRAAPQVEGATIAFRYLAAAMVAGDIFEFLDPSPRGVGILVADVSGHGVAAALIASMVKMAAAAQKEHAADPARVLAGMHLALADELPPAQFVTAVYVYLDLEQSVLRHASAGHPPALLRTRATGQVQAAGPGGPLLIALAPPGYPVTETRLAPGDRVLLFTDGVVEAMRADDEMFGVERLSALLAAGDGDVDALLSAVVREMSAFSGRSTSHLEDDCTLVALEITQARA